MGVEICLRINDDGTMTVSQETTEQESAEGMQDTGTMSAAPETEGTPVKNIAQALQVIQEMADAATLAQPDVMEEDSAMMEGFSQR